MLVRSRPADTTVLGQTLDLPMMEVAQRHKIVQFLGPVALVRLVMKLHPVIPAYKALLRQAALAIPRGCFSPVVRQPVLHARDAMAQPRVNASTALAGLKVL